MYREGVSCNYIKNASSSVIIVFVKQNSLIHILNHQQEVFHDCAYITGEPIKIQRRRPQSAKCQSPSNDCVSKDSPRNVYRTPERPKSDKYYSSPICRRISDVTVSDSTDSPCPSPPQYKGICTWLLCVSSTYTCVFRKN